MSIHDDMKKALRVPRRVITLTDGAVPLGKGHPLSQASAEGLWGKYSKEDHPHTACVADFSDDMGEDDAHAFCTRVEEMAAGTNPAQRTAAAKKIAKGDKPGHAFHGNQWKEGDSARFEGDSPDGKIMGGGMPVTIVNPHSNADKVTNTDKRGRQYEGAFRHLPTATVKNSRGTVFEAYHHQLSVKKMSRADEVRKALLEETLAKGE